MAADWRKAYASLAAKTAKLEGRNDEFGRELLERIEQIDFGSKTKPFKVKKSNKTDRFVNLLVSDLHFGSDLDPDETPQAYGRHEERRAFAQLVKEVVEYKPHYRHNTNLALHWAGDFIDGRLHDLASAAPVAEQATRAIYLGTQMVRRCAEQYPHVDVYCTPGNHGRNKARHPSRAVNQKWDSIENIIYEACRVATSSIPNVRFHIPRTPYYVYEQFGRKGFVTHGDTVLNPGYPNRAINVANLEKQILKLQQNQKYDLFAVGHVHVPSVVQLPSALLVTNGCLIPPDAYATSIGLLTNVRVQQLWETVPEFFFGDHRMVSVEGSEDNAELDWVIPAERYVHQ